MKPPHPAQLAHAAMDKALALGGPMILAHIRRLRRTRPDATPAQLLKALERHYLTTVAAGGGIAGATSAAAGRLAIKRFAEFSLVGWAWVW